MRISFENALPILFSLICMLSTISATQFRTSYGMRSDANNSSAIATDFGLPNDCTGHCTKNIFAALRAALDGSATSLLREFPQMCKNYDETKQCLTKIGHCKVTVLYNALISGMRYMCEHQRLAIDSNLKCVNDGFPTIQQACDRQCHSETIATGLTVKQIFQEDIKLLKMFDQHMGRLTTNEACRLSNCMIKCYRTKINLSCDGSVGSVLTEGLIRPYSEIQELGSFFNPMVAMIIPRQCSFLTNPKEMAELRIDPALDQSVFTLYSEKFKSSITVAPFNNPLENFTTEEYERSPLDEE
ncbi:hypothetical protein M3Y94_00419400 [Aphelenchoides besseyi]|nr:hypothetical protein M3Y94_00419400 [Aphelenchoides besseyi]KAI6229581.1 hypothetical protein M3Y95_00545900 [Aphelenchoides besseyi]